LRKINAFSSKRIILFEKKFKSRRRQRKCAVTLGKLTARYSELGKLLRFAAD